MRNISTLLCLAVLAASQALSQATPDSSKDVPQPQQRVDLSTRDYEVLSFVLDHVLGGEKQPHHRQWVVLDHTSIGIPPGAAGLTRMPDKEVKAIQDEAKPLLDSLLAENKQSANVNGNALHCSVPIISMSDDALAKFFGKGGGYWEAFYKSYPSSQGVTLVSRPVFSSDGKNALAYIGTMSQMLAGEGFLVMLEKSGDTWKVKHRGMTWIS